MLQRTRLRSCLSREALLSPSRKHQLFLCVSSAEITGKTNSPVCWSSSGRRASSRCAGRAAGRGCPWRTRGSSTAGLATDSASTPSLGSCICISTVSAPPPVGTSGSYCQRRAGRLAGTSGEDHGGEERIRKQPGRGWEDAGASSDS